MEEQILELTRQVTILNERLPNHITWTERNVKDHEIRIRQMEAALNQLKNADTDIKNLMQFKWVMLGLAGASGSIGAFIARAFGA